MHTGITGITELAVKRGLTNRLPCWEIIADNLSKAGFSWGCVSVDSNGRIIWIAEAHRGDGSRPRKGRAGGVGRRVGVGCETCRREPQP
jgi:hypothetical protein